GIVHENPVFQAWIPVQGYGQSFVPPYRKYDDLIQSPAYNWANIYPPALVHIAISRQLIRTFHPKLYQAAALLGPRQEKLELYSPNWMLLRRKYWPEPYASYARDFPLLLRALKEQNSRLILCPFPFREQIIPAEFAAQRDKLIAAGHSPDDI